MIHHRTAQNQATHPAGRDIAIPGHSEIFTLVEASASAVRKAKRAADESLRRAQDAPEPHATTNVIFVTLYEAHLRDRETLFAAMRRLDDAQSALRTISRTTLPIRDGE